jgi:hypothetical protein
MSKIETAVVPQRMCSKTKWRSSKMVARQRSTRTIAWRSETPRQ